MARAAWSDADWYARLYDQAVESPGPVTDALGAAAKEAGAWIAVGVNERVTSGTLYNTLLYLDPEGDMAGVHRKILPTGGENTVWGRGDGSTLTVIETEFGRVGGLLCWENLMPLARAAMYEQGVDIYLAPTWDNSDSWICTLRHIAREGRMFVVGTNTCLHSRDIPRTLPGADDLYPPNDDDWPSRGNTVIVGPATTRRQRRRRCPGEPEATGRHRECRVVTASGSVCYHPSSSSSDRRCSNGTNGGGRGGHRSERGSP